jgi:hypothetical protein
LYRLGLHTILLDFGGVTVGFAACSFGCHTILFFFSGVGIFSIFLEAAFFFCSVFSIFF